MLGLNFNQLLDIYVWAVQSNKDDTAKQIKYALINYHKKAPSIQSIYEEKGKLAAIKEYKLNEDCSLMAAKKLVEEFAESGNWKCLK